MQTLTLISVFLLIIEPFGTQFINNPSDSIFGCDGETAYFNWTFDDTATPAFFVEWKKNGARIALEQVAAGQPFQPESSYIGRLTRISNAQISLGPLAIADSGTYTSEVTYTDGSGDLSNSIRLSVYDVLNNKTEIDETSGILTPCFYDSSITYTWKSPDNVISIGNSLTVSISGNYTLCVSEGKASCLNPTIDPCASIYVIKQTGLSQEILIASIISSALAAGVLILLVVLIMKQCRRKTRGTPAKTKANYFSNKQDNVTKKDDLKSFQPRKSKVLKKRNTKPGSSSLEKKKNAQSETTAPKGRIYQHYPQTIDYWNSCGNRHVFKNSNTEGNVMLFGNQHAKYLPPYSRPNNRMPYQSHHSDHIGHNEGMLQYYRADNMYRGQQMNQMQYIAVKDKYMKDKPDSKRISDKTPYERNWDMLY